MFKKKSGQSLVELLLAVGLLAIILPALLAGLYVSREGKVQQDVRYTASNLLKEAGEAVRSAREKNWVNIVTNGVYYPKIAADNSWELINSLTGETIDATTQMTRKIEIGDIYRDTNGAIVATGGNLDPSTRKAIITVDWQAPIASEITSTIYLTRYLDNVAWIQTTKADFDAGILNGTGTEYTGGSPTDGDIILGAGAQANWCRPQDAIRDALTLPKQGNSVVSKQGSVYVGSGDGTDGVTFVNLGISNPPQPTPAAANIDGTYSSSYKTNAVFADGSYVYLATDSGTEQVIILDISSLPYTIIGTVTIAGSQPANGLFVSGNILYVTSGNKLYTYDVTIKTGAHTTPLGSRAMWFNIGSQPSARQVVVVNNNAFVGTGNTLFGLQKFRITNGGHTITFVGASNLTWNQQSQGLAVNSTGTRAYVAFNQGAGGFPKGFFIVDTSTDPPWWWPFFPVRGSYNAGDMDPRGMALGTGNKAILVGVGGTQQYQVIDIANDNPTLCGGLPVTNGVYGVSALLEDDGDAYSYIITGETMDQFKIIQGGSGGAYATSGTFESSILEPPGGYDRAFNRFEASINTNSGVTNIRTQIAVAQSVAGNCSGANYNYIGPDGTSVTYFNTSDGLTIKAAVPLIINGNGYTNPGSCFRYKLFLSTIDSNMSPVFNDIKVNYSP